MSIWGAMKVVWRSYNTLRYPITEKKYNICDLRMVVIFKIYFFWHPGISFQPCMLHWALSGSQTCAARTLLLISFCSVLTHWSQLTHICVNKLIIISSDNGLSHGRRQDIIWTNAGLLLIGQFNEILIELYTLSFKKMHLKMSSGNWRPSYFGLIVLSN